MGLGGLEPPTSPLSGVRSSHLSYRPFENRVAFPCNHIILRRLSIRCNCASLRFVHENGRASCTCLLPPTMRFMGLKQRCCPIVRTASSRLHRSPRTVVDSRWLHFPVQHRNPFVDDARVDVFYDHFADQRTVALPAVPFSVILRKRICHTERKVPKKIGPTFRAVPPLFCRVVR